MGRLIQIDRDRDGVTVSVDLATSLPLGLVVHKGEREASLRLLFHRAGGTMLRPARAARFPREDNAAAENLIIKLRDRLREIAQKPLSPRQVERLLNITPAERNRWSKDGRLARSGTTTIRKGPTVISLATYSPDAVEVLLKRPEIIARWRDRDRDP